MVEKDILNYTLGKSSKVRISKSHRYLYEILKKKQYSNVEMEYYHKGYFIDILVNGILAIEVDGAHWHNSPTAIEYDKKRDSIISETYKVYRINPDNLIWIDLENILNKIKLLVDANWISKNKHIEVQPAVA